MSELQWSINADGSQSVTVPFRGLTVRVPLGTAAALGGGSPFAADGVRGQGAGAHRGEPR